MYFIILVQLTILAIVIKDGLVVILIRCSKYQTIAIQGSDIGITISCMLKWFNGKCDKTLARYKCGIPFLLDPIGNAMGVNMLHLATKEYQIL